MPVRSIEKFWGIALAALLFVGVSVVSANAQVSVAGLGADLSGTCSASEMTLMVSAARSEGMSDEQIANAFGRASTATACPDALAQGYSNFSGSSDSTSESLTAAYNAGIDTANRTGLGGSGGSGADDGFNPPSGGSGGGGGSSNE